MKKMIVVAMSALLLVSALSVTATAKDNSRKWKATYNSALSLHEAAIPKVYKVGSKVKVCYRNNNNCLVVKAVAGSCTCFDISDEAFRKLAGSTSQGVITITATKR